MIYTAKLGDKYRIEPFDLLPLKLDHTSQILPANVTYVDYNTVKIYTNLEYEVGQFVSVGGYPIGGNKFQMIELSITDFPVLANAMITEKEEE